MKKNSHGLLKTCRSKKRPSWSVDFRTDASQYPKAVDWLSVRNVGMPIQDRGTRLRTRHAMSECAAHAASKAISHRHPVPPKQSGTMPSRTCSPARTRALCSEKSGAKAEHPRLATTRHRSPHTRGCALPQQTRATAPLISHATCISCRPHSKIRTRYELLKRTSC